MFPGQERKCESIPFHETGRRSTSNRCRQPVLVGNEDRLSNRDRRPPTQADLAEGSVDKYAAIEVHFG